MTAPVATRTQVYEIGTYVDEKTGERIPNRIGRVTTTPQELRNMRAMSMGWRTGENAASAHFHFEGVEEVLVFEVTVR